MGKSQGPAIGIDLGTTYSCVAVLRDNKVTIVPNGLGTPTTPSFIAFDDNNQVTVGDVAKNQANLKPDNTIFDVKRLIGRSFNDPVVQKDIKLWPFHVFDDNGTPKIKVNNKTYYAEVISAKLLSNLRKQAEEFLGCPVQDAVITVPAYFNDGQRQATKDAGAIAGLNVLRIINEPTAAAIAYCHQVKPSKKKNILVFDLGGGTFDIAILSMDDNKIKVLAVGGDTHLGGEDFDAAMADHCIKEFETKHGINLADGKNSEDPLTKFRAKKFLRRLKNECEHQKMNLVGAKSASVSLENVTSSLDLNVKFTRAQFDSLNNDMFEKCIQIIDQVLKDISMPKDDIDEIVMVGGSSKIVRIQEMVQDYFGGKQLSKTIRPDEAVAYGAAVQAALMTFDEESDVNNQANYDRNTTKTGKKPEPPKRIEIYDVIPLPVGIKVWVEEGNENDFCIILEKNTSVPSKKMKLFSTPHANCTQLDISVYEGESQSTSLNHLLGRFVLQNLPPHCRQGERIDVTMEVNDEGILHVGAECPATKSKGQITVDEFKGRLTPDEISNLMEELFVSHSTLDL